MDTLSVSCAVGRIELTYRNNIFDHLFIDTVLIIPGAPNTFSEVYKFPRSA